MSCFRLDFHWIGTLICAALLASTACDSKSQRVPPIESEPRDAAPPLDAESESDPPRRSVRPTRSTDAGRAFPESTERDASIPGARTRDAEAEPERDASEPSGADSSPHSDASTARGGERGETGETPDSTADLDGGAAEPEPDAAPAAEEIHARMKGVTLKGGLCPEVSYEPSISGDGAALTVTFSAAQVQTETGQDREGECEVALLFDVEDGWQFSNLGVRPTGYFYTDRGTAELEVRYAIPSFDTAGTFSHLNLMGDEEYAFDDPIAAWSATCEPGSNRGLQLVLGLRLAARDAAYLNVSALDLEFAAHGGTRWRTCAGATEE